MFLACFLKVIIAMETGIIPPNLYYKNPREGVKALEEGRIQVVTEKTPFEGGYVGVNSFGFGGANAHILLKSNTKEKVNNGAPTDDLPRLVTVSGRTKEAVDEIINDVCFQITSLYQFSIISLYLVISLIVLLFDSSIANQLMLNT